MTKDDRTAHWCKMRPFSAKTRPVALDLKDKAMAEPLSARERIWQVVAAIPPGKVAHYGQIAKLAGLGRGARQVGHTLRELPTGTSLPWHRVINSQGRISLPKGSSGYEQQKSRLEAEGVEFNLSGKISLQRFGWD